MNTFNEVLGLQEVSVFHDDRVILRDVHMSLSSGEFCYLRGESNSGKSSFLHALYGLNEIQGARMNVAGVNLRELTRKTLATFRRKIGLISPIYPLMKEESVFNNLDSVLSLMEWSVASEREKRVHTVLDQLGLNQVQGERIYELPSGMRQKVSIARAVLHKPDIILADNPMIHLDNKSTDEVMSLFIHMVRDHKSAILCAVSDSTLIDQYPSRSYLCADGTITEYR